MSISQLHLHPFDEKKIYCNENAKQEAERIKGRAINKKISNWDLNEMQTFKISTLNIRSLKKHFIDLKQDHLLQKSDIICVNETWLESDPAEDLNNYHGYFLNLNSRGNAIFCKMEPNKVHKMWNLYTGLSKMFLNIAVHKIDIILLETFVVCFLC